MKEVIVYVERSDENLSAYIEGVPIITVGDDINDIKTNIKEAIELYLEDNSCDLLSGDYELIFKERN